MRLAKLSYHITLKNSTQKCADRQTQSGTGAEKDKDLLDGSGLKYPLSVGKRFSGSKRGSGCGGTGGGRSQRNSSVGNGSCISSTPSGTATTATTTTTSNTNRSSSTSSSAGKQRRKSTKPTKCFSSTVFRCCLPCRGGGSAAPATSPPLSPVQTPSDGDYGGGCLAEKRGLVGAQNDYEQKEALNDDKKSKPKQPKIKNDHHDHGDDDDELETKEFPREGEGIISEKKHSLADTIGTSVTTPISLKTLINDVDEDLEHPLSAADIAAATLASGIVARKAEPETLSDASVSPTAAVLLQASAGIGNSLSAAITTTTTIYATTRASPINGATNLTVVTTTPTTTSTPPSLSVATSLAPILLSQNIQGGSTQANVSITSPSTTTTTTTQAARCSCQPQTSPLPHIKEEEESEQQHNNNKHQLTLVTYYEGQEPIEAQAPSAVTSITEPTELSSSTTFCGSCESVHHSSSATTGGGTGTGSSTAGQSSSGQGGDYTGTSTPSPRIKLKFRKPHKSCWSRIVLTPIGAGALAIGSNSNETLASTGSNSNTNTTNNSSSASVANAGHLRLASSSASALASHPSNTQLAPAKMQAEQGSIGDLQKYHSRYLKNRRHTLANVR